MRDLCLSAWYSLLKLSYTPRRAMGLNREGMAQLKTKLGK
jgi:hypothetical protein